MCAYSHAQIIQMSDLLLDVTERDAGQAPGVNQ